MKVEEAKTKVCPFSFGIEAHFVEKKLGNLIPNGNKSFGINCICGDCMAWVWEYTFENGQSASDGYCARIEK